MGVPDPTIVATPAQPEGTVPEPEASTPPQTPGVEPQTPQQTQSRRQAAADNEEIQRLQKENRDLQLNSLLTSAGVDPNKDENKARVEFFKKGYDGDLTLDAVTAQVNALGLSAGTTQTTPGEVVLEPGEASQTQERQNLGRGSTPDGGTPSEDPRLAGIKAGDAIMEQGGTMEAGIGAFFDTVAAAGYNGDQRAQFIPGKTDPRRPDPGW